MLTYLSRIASDYYYVTADVRANEAGLRIVLVNEVVAEVFEDNIRNMWGHLPGEAPPKRENGSIIMWDTRGRYLKFVGNHGSEHIVIEQSRDGGGVQGEERVRPTRPRAADHRRGGHDDGRKDQVRRAQLR